VFLVLIEIMRFSMSISPTDDKTLSRAVSDISLAASSGSEELVRERTLEVVELITCADAKIRGP
jgi:hypothetical protein